MADDERVTEMVEAAFAIANKPEGERGEDDLKRLREIGAKDPAIYNAAFQTIRLQGEQAGASADYWKDAADAVTSAAQGDGLALKGGPGFGIVERRDI